MRNIYFFFNVLKLKNIFSFIFFRPFLIGWPVSNYPTPTRRPRQNLVVILTFINIQIRPATQMHTSSFFNNILSLISQSVCVDLFISSLSWVTEIYFSGSSDYREIRRQDSGVQKDLMKLKEIQPLARIIVYFLENRWQTFILIEEKQILKRHLGVLYRVQFIIKSQLHHETFSWINILIWIIYINYYFSRSFPEKESLCAVWDMVSVNKKVSTNRVNKARKFLHSKVKLTYIFFQLWNRKFRNIISVSILFIHSEEGPVGSQYHIPPTFI